MKISVIVLSMVFLLCPLLIAYAEEGEKVPSKQKSMSFETQVVKTVKLNYLLYLPKDYGKDKEQKFPLIMFLHGAGERGDDLEKVKIHGIPKIVEQKDDFPFIAVSPQCPEDSWWDTDALKALLDEIVAKYEVDPDRVYLTGLSMGGYGSWALGIAYPNKFAAIVPICGGGDEKKVAVLKDVPIWVFHGAKDSVVPLAQSEKMVNALKEAGGNVQFTIYPEADHDSWTATYDNPELYEWLLKQKRENK
jgi:predicted peptidase